MRYNFRNFQPSQPPDIPAFSTPQSAGCTPALCPPTTLALTPRGGFGTIPAASLSSVCKPLHVRSSRAPCLLDRVGACRRAGSRCARRIRTAPDRRDRPAHCRQRLVTSKRNCQRQGNSRRHPAREAANPTATATIAAIKPLWQPFDFLRDWGFRHSSTHGRHVGLGLPLDRTSWLNRPFHVDWFAGPLLGDTLAANGDVRQKKRDVWRRSYLDGTSTTTGVCSGASAGHIPNSIPPQSINNTSSEGRYFISDIDVLYYPWGDSTVRPYALLGLGVNEVESLEQDGTGLSATLLAMPFGVGVEFPQTPLAGVAVGNFGQSRLRGQRRDDAQQFLVHRRHGPPHGRPPAVVLAMALRPEGCGKRRSAPLRVTPGGMVTRPCARHGCQNPPRCRRLGAWPALPLLTMLQIAGELPSLAGESAGSLPRFAFFKRGLIAKSPSSKHQRASAAPLHTHRDGDPGGRARRRQLHYHHSRRRELVSRTWSGRSAHSNLTGEPPSAGSLSRQVDAGAGQVSR